MPPAWAVPFHAGATVGLQGLLLTGLQVPHWPYLVAYSYQYFHFPLSESKKPRLGYQSGLFRVRWQPGFLPGCLPRCSIDEVLWAARVLAKVKAIIKPPRKHSSHRRHRIFSESLRNIQLTDRVYAIHAFQYIPLVFNLATHCQNFLELGLIV
jgi:hypothetical protein